MKRFPKLIRRHGRTTLWAVGGLGAIAGLMLLRLWSITPGLSPVEQASSQATYGWTGLYHSPFDLPLNLVRSIVFSVAGHHGILLTRLPNVLFGVMTIVLFGILIKYWHGNRTAVLATVLFGCSAWLLHISRLASSDVLYLWAIPLLLVVQLYMLRSPTKPVIWYGALISCGLLLYVPGMVLFVALSLYWQRQGIVAGWRRFSLWWQRLLYIFAGLAWLPVLLLHITKLTNLKIWLGLPHNFVLNDVGRQLAFVPVHLLVRGPLDSQRWLGHAPLLDAFTLVVTLGGIWFYVSHFRAIRSRILGSYWLLGIILVGLGGSAGLSLLVPLVYIFAATGIAYLIHEWLAVFPVNPIARKLGIGLVVVAVGASCLYNLRAYFVAWPHDTTTLATFHDQK
jgi:hypothetical protein